MQSEYCNSCRQPLEEWEAGLCEGCGTMAGLMQKKMTGVYCFESHSVCVTLIKTDAGWTSTYRSPFGTRGIVKVTRRTRSLAAADAIAHLNEDAELYST